MSSKCLVRTILTSALMAIISYAVFNHSDRIKSSVNSELILQAIGSFVLSGVFCIGNIYISIMLTPLNPRTRWFKAILLVRRNTLAKIGFLHPDNLQLGDYEKPKTAESFDSWTEQLWIQLLKGPIFTIGFVNFQVICLQLYNIRFLNNFLSILICTGIEFVCLRELVSTDWMDLVFINEDKPKQKLIGEGMANQMERPPENIEEEPLNLPQRPRRRNRNRPGQREDAAGQQNLTDQAGNQEGQPNGDQALERNKSRNPIEELPQVILQPPNLDMVRAQGIRVIEEGNLELRRPRHRLKTKDMFPRNMESSRENSGIARSLSLLMADRKSVV